MMSLWDALRMNMMISYQELVRTFLSCCTFKKSVTVSITSYAVYYVISLAVSVNHFFDAIYIIL
ncbi:hypothetical protein P847_05529 [Klebsiella pneumoniae UCI 44]|nr:hypothetical protein P847_05529 [Klebsiella pneumoniae UCI 44]